MKLQSMWMSMSLGLLPVMFMMGGCGKGEEVVSREQLNGRLQGVLEQVVQDAKIPGVLIHLRGSKVGTWSGAAGLGNMETKRVMASSDKFRAGSIMKMFVSVVTMQLVEERRFALDTPISDLLPKHVVGRFGGCDGITVRMLLNHTGGLAEWVTDAMDVEIAANPHKIWQDSELLDIAAAHGPTFAPGEGWAYSNTHFILLGEIIEETTGRSWRTEVDERIILKLGLQNTRLPKPGDRFVSADHARGYHRMDSKFVDLTDVDPSMAGAAGGHALETSTTDLVDFLDAVMAGQFFKHHETLGEMLRFVDAPDENGIPYYYGLAMEKYVLPGGIEIIGHAGTTAGFASIVYYLPAQKMTVSMVINTQDLASVYFKVLLPVLEALKPANLS